MSRDTIRPTHAYIGRCPTCGKLLSSVYDMVDDTKFTGKSVANMIADGLKVERVPLETVQFDGDCDCHKKVEPPPLPLFEAVQA